MYPLGKIVTSITVKSIGNLKMCFQLANRAPQDPFPLVVLFPESQ